MKKERLMFYKTYIKDRGKELKTNKKAPKIVKEVTQYLSPLIKELQSKADKRFSYTLYDSFYGLLSHRDKANS